MASKMLGLCSSFSFAADLTTYKSDKSCKRQTEIPHKIWLEVSS